MSHHRTIIRHTSISTGQTYHSTSWSWKTNGTTCVSAYCHRDQTQGYGHCRTRGTAQWIMLGIVCVEGTLIMCWIPQGMGWQVQKVHESHKRSTKGCILCCPHPPKQTNTHNLKLPFLGTYLTHSTRKIIQTCLRKFVWTSTWSEGQGTPKESHQTRSLQLYLRWWHQPPERDVPPCCPGRRDNKHQENHMRRASLKKSLSI